MFRLAQSIPFGDCERGTVEGDCVLKVCGTVYGVQQDGPARPSVPDFSPLLADYSHVSRLKESLYRCRLCVPVYDERLVPRGPDADDSQLIFGVRVPRGHRLDALGGLLEQALPIYHALVSINLMTRRTRDFSASPRS